MLAREFAENLRLDTFLKSAERFPIPFDRRTNSMKFPLTPGTQRVIDHALELAAQSALSPQSDHLLKALFAAEVSASAAFTQFNVTIAQFEEWKKCHLSADDSSGVALDDILSAASACARERNEFELSSEHLLIGLVDQPSSESVFLCDRGMGRDTLEKFFYGAEVAPQKPLAVDFELGLADANSGKNVTGENFLSEKVAGRSNSETHVAVFRVIDAAANRFREGVRTLEDYARFILDDVRLTERLKSLRHSMTTALAGIDQNSLLAARDTVDDVGTTLSTPQELSRSNIHDVLVAACKRSQEAARSLEEFGKIVCGHAAATAKQIRYELYSVEKIVLGAVVADKAMSAKHDLRNRKLYVLVTESTCRNDWRKTVKHSIAGGVSIIQLREKTLDDAELVARGRWLRDVTREADVLFIMNDRPDLAVLTDADGVHVGQEELSVADVRRIVGNRLVGVSTHDIVQARQAVADGADYIGVGPCFPSNTKAFDAFPGLDFVREVAAEISIPWYPIGGIDGERISQLTAAGATSAAVSGAVCGSECAESSARKLSRLLGS